MSITELREAVEASSTTGYGPSWNMANAALPHNAHLVLAAFTGSLDAAKSLHDALLPGWQWLTRSGDEDDVRVNKCQPGQSLANIWGEGSPNEGAACFPSWADNPARAWLLSILRAMEEGR